MPASTGCLLERARANSVGVGVMQCAVETAANAHSERYPTPFGQPAEGFCISFRSAVSAEGPLSTRSAE